MNGYYLALNSYLPAPFFFTLPLVAACALLNLQQLTEEGDISCPIAIISKAFVFNELKQLLKQNIVEMQRSEIHIQIHSL